MQIVLLWIMRWYRKTILIFVQILPYFSHYHHLFMSVYCGAFKDFQTTYGGIYEIWKKLLAHHCCVVFSNRKKFRFHPHWQNKSWQAFWNRTCKSFTDLNVASSLSSYALLCRPICYRLNKALTRLVIILIKASLKIAKW